MKQAIKYKYEIIKDKIIFKEFEKLITSTTNKINHKDYVDRYLENVKDLLKDIFPRRDQNKLLLDIFSYDNSISEEIEGQITSSLVESINNNLVLYDSFFEKWSDVSDSQIISSKSSFINRSKKLVSDTKSDLNKLKQSVGKNNYQFSNLVNEIYNRVNASVIMCFNKEMDKLNSAIELGTTSTITSTSFKSYVDILEESSKAISSINCSIKSTLNENLKVIRKINGQLLEMKSRNRTSSYGGGSSYSGGSTYSGGSSSTDEEMPAGVWIFGIIIAIIIFSNC